MASGCDVIQHNMQYKVLHKSELRYHLHTHPLLHSDSLCLTDLQVQQSDQS